LFFAPMKKDISINIYNRIVTPKKSLISLRQKNKYVSFAMEAIIIKLSICWYIFTGRRYFTNLYSGFCLSCPRETNLVS
jgi:hypothetical protein